MHKTLLLILCLWGAASASAQHANFGKMSPLVRQLTLQERAAARRAPARDSRELCAFVRVTGDGASVLSSHGCRSLAQWGDIHIASIPIHALPALSLHPLVSRIEARQGTSLLMDTTTVLMGGLKSHHGEGLPQAFTGRGVLVGVEDVGFDLTHPNFYDRELTRYRILRFWDFLSTDTVGSNLYVGADYTDEAALLSYAHSRDAGIQSHGTHTLGSAAGSGYDTNYIGMAPGSDICVVSNAVTEDLALIDSADVYKFTYATDCLGFKYIFNYADQLGRPCVVSFSEGSSMDFRGDDELYYAIIDSITGPGHILVASAGNSGQVVTHVCKPSDVATASVALLSSSKAAYFSAKGVTDRYTLRFQLGGPEGLRAEYPVTVEAVYATTDSLLTDTLKVGDIPYYITASCYPSCFNPLENVLEVILQSDRAVGKDQYAGVDVEGEGTEVHLFRGSGQLIPSDKSMGDNSYSIHSPSSAPSVISVGATGYRTGVVNYLGEYRPFDMGTSGERSAYSSVGPTFDGRIKPDVMAPGTNVISSYSSYYIEASPDANDLKSDVARFDFRGRTYAWNANSGTSMSTPVVAGAIALWLEAKPSLTPSEAMEVIAATSRHYDPSLEYPNNLYGYGEIDAYAGLLHILGISNVKGLSSHQPSAVDFSLHQKDLTLHFNKEVSQPVSVRVFAVNGSLQKSLKTTPQGGNISISLASLPKDVYAVQVDGPDATTTGSTLVRVE
ncbi:MAG: S8 family serine peptidase [Prevotella sp.]|nr:S8 family serine peptidase [Prevotella sp.]